MAMVDFSNARIEVNSTDTESPTKYANVNLAGGYLYDASGNVIGGSNISQLINQQKQLMYNYQGTFSASGTEFYVVGNGYQARWKISNISFSSGDTYVFQINASLVCN